MTRTYKLKISGGGEIDLINTGATGIIASRGGFGGFRIPEEMLEGGKIAETYVLNLKGSSHDNAASQIQTFIALLRMCKLYHEELWQTQPGHIITQTTGELYQRYALVYTAVELEFPDLFNQPFESSSLIEEFSLTIIREHPWRHRTPGQKNVALTFDPTDGPTTPKLVHISNFRDDEDVDSIYVDDGGVFSSNYASSTSFSLFPATAVADDALYIGSAGPWHHIVFIVGSPGDYDADLIFEYWNGSWTALTYGTDYTLYPNGDEDEIFKSSGDWAINFFGKSDWTTTSVNGQTKYWIRIRVVSVTTWTSTPTNSPREPYSQRTPEARIPDTTIKGDSPPLFLFRFLSSAGGDENPRGSSLSRILIGAKSRGLTKFISHLNAGGDDNPTDWTTTQGTDATATADPLAPGGKHSAVSFSTNEAMVKRVEFSGDNILSSWVGEYKAMLRCQQIGGDVGDLRVMLRTFIGSTANSAPHINSQEVKLAAYDKGIEVIDFGLLRIPFARTFYDDTLTNTDLIFQVFAERSTGSSTLRIYDLILLPVDEGSVGLDDPVSDLDLGSSALRGLNALDMDNGVIDWRALKYFIEGSNLIPAESWAIQNRPPPFKNLATDTRLYFLMLHYPEGGDWGVGPMIASLGCHLACELYGHYRYSVLRGAD